MKIAAISDIHGNLEALNAVINDIKKENADKIFVCGYLAVAGPNPVEVIDLLQELSSSFNMEFILGNTDEMIIKANEKEGLNYYPGNLAMKSAVKQCQKALRENQKNFLASLPEKKTVEIGKIKILLVHGSPRNINENINPDMDLDAIKKIINGYSENIIICGHTHLPVIYNTENQTVLNCGSVGRPFTDHPEASYSIIDYPDLNSEEFKIFHKYIKYENHITANKLEKLNFEGSKWLAKIIINPAERNAPVD